MKKYITLDYEEYLKLINLKDGVGNLLYDIYKTTDDEELKKIICEINRLYGLWV